MKEDIPPSRNLNKSKVKQTVYKKVVCEDFLSQIGIMAEFFQDYVIASVHTEKFWVLVKTCAAPADSTRLANWPKWLQQSSFHRRLYFFILLYTHTIDNSFEFKRQDFSIQKLKEPLMSFLFDFEANATTLDEIKAMVKWERSLHLQFYPVHFYFKNRFWKTQYVLDNCGKTRFSKWIRGKWQK